MGHIKLAAPVAHIWFLRGVPSRLGLILDLGVQELEKVVYFAAYIITSVDEEARMSTMEQIEREFKSKKKEIEDKYETLIAKSRVAPQAKASKKEAGAKDQDLAQAEIDAEVTRLKDAWSKELEGLESIRDQARSEL